MFLLVLTRHKDNGDVLDGAIIDFEDEKYPGNDAIDELVYAMPFENSTAIVGSVSSDGQIIHIVERIQNYGEN